MAYAKFVDGEPTRILGGLGITLAAEMKAGTTHGGWGWERALGAAMRVLRDAGGRHARLGYRGH